MADDLKEVIIRYKLVLDQLDEEFPRDFKLQILVQQMKREASMKAAGCARMRRVAGRAWDAARRVAREGGQPPPPNP